MDWVVLLLAVSPLAYLGTRLYYRAAAGPRLTAQALSTMGSLAGLVLLSGLAIGAAFRGRIPESVDDAFGLF